MKKQKLRRLGDITQDLEPLILEMVEDHDMQAGEILSLVYGYLQIHAPASFEIYEEDLSRPIYYYGHRSGVK